VAIAKGGVLEMFRQFKRTKQSCTPGARVAVNNVLNHCFIAYCGAKNQFEKRRSLVLLFETRPWVNQ